MFCRTSLLLDCLLDIPPFFYSLNDRGSPALGFLSPLHRVFFSLRGALSHRPHRPSRPKVGLRIDRPFSGPGSEKAKWTVAIVGVPPGRHSAHPRNPVSLSQVPNPCPWKREEGSFPFVGKDPRFVAAHRLGSKSNERGPSTWQAQKSPSNQFRAACDPEHGVAKAVRARRARRLGH